MKRVCLVLFMSVFLIGSSAALAQTLGTIRGMVKMADGTPLPGVAVYIRGTDKSTSTDKNGFFSLTGIVQGEVTIFASLDGFAEEIRTIIVQAGRVVVLNLTLEPTKLSEEVSVTAERPLLSTSEKASKITLTPRQISTLPSLGENDIFRAFQLLPGILGSNEASSGLYVRGGTPDQNLVLYDGFTVYHVDHLFGYFSAFNMEALDEVQLSKGGFESKFGGRISSVMELKGKSGDFNEFKFGAGVSMLSVNGLAEIPLFNKGSIFIAGRRSFQSPLYNTIADMFDSSSTSQFARQRPGGGGGRGGERFGAMFESEPSSYFYDLNAKLTFQPSKKDVLSLSFYNGEDDLDNSRTMETPSFMAERGIIMDSETIDLTEWGNTGLSFEWSRVWNSIFQSQITLAYSDYFNNRDRTRSMTLTLEEGVEPPPFWNSEEPRSFERGSIEDNDLEDLTFRWDNTFSLHPANELALGFQVTSNTIRYDYEVDQIQEEEDDPGPGPGRGNRQLVGILDREDKGTQYSFYIQDRWTLFDKLTITPGLRATYFDRTEETYYEPRFSFNLNLSKEFRLKGAWGKYNQFANRVAREDIEQGNREFWILSGDETIPVSKAIHTIAGISYETEDLLFDIEAYHKNLSGLSEFALRFTPTSEDIDYNRFFFEGTGTAKGLEFLFQKKSGRLTGWLGYTLGQVEYTFPDLEDQPYPALHDQIHEFKLVGIYELSEKLTLSGTWIYATGKPYTEPEGIEEVSLFGGMRTIERIILGDKNGARLPAYHRMDLSLSYDFKIGEADSTLGLTIFNLYGRKNVWYKEFDILEGEIVESDFNLMGLTFNFYFNIKF